MSLINKMLQDLDARGGDGARSTASSAVRPVDYASRSGLSPLAIGAAVVALAVVGGAGFAAYKYFRGGAQPVPASAAVQAAKPAAQQARGPVAAADADEGAPVVPGGIPPEQHRAAGEEMTRRMEERQAAARRAAAEKRAAEPTAAAVRAGASAKPVGVTEKPRVAAVRRDEMWRIGSRAPGTEATAPAGGAVTANGADTGLSSQQKAENEYRRALAHLQDARVTDAISGLEQAVYLYPRHDAARQTLVSLLIEGGRAQEAIRHLTFATNLDPRQTNMAMLLARMQLEHGGNALDTLNRSLPYAESNADYRALMAGVLQRQNRHKEAADHYQAALRQQPGNAVWWMGMGISLQADKRNAEAKVAFQRARDTGRLAPELQSFVERRLQQLN